MTLPTGSTPDANANVTTLEGAVVVLGGAVVAGDSTVLAEGISAGTLDDTGTVGSPAGKVLVASVETPAEPELQLASTTSSQAATLTRTVATDRCAAVGVCIATC
jgi:hypothetical protein